MRTYTIEVADETGTDLDLLLAGRTDGLTVETLLRTHLETTAAANVTRLDDEVEMELNRKFKLLSREEKATAVEKTEP